MDATVVVDFSPLICAQQELESSLEHTPQSKQTDLAKISSFIDRFTASETKIVVPEFGRGLQWFNTSRPLTLHTDLHGRIVVLDFFTYCCINCMHILPDLELLEERFADRGVVVVGVHSAKFDNEKIVANVINAVMRYNIHHPVVNDVKGSMWSLLSIICWPTLLILSPRAEVLFVLMGEGDCDLLTLLVEGVVEHYEVTKQIVQKGDLPLQLLRLNLPESPLWFPGKIACCPNDDVNGTLCVADSGHNRILVLTSDGIIRETIGGNESGFVDGKFDVAKFSSPQGVAWKSSDFIYVADTENHAIREIDLLARTVRTLVGNGRQGTDLEGGRVGSKQEISSPWDLCIACWNNPDGDFKEGLLVIAMAGTHQIWGLALKTVTLPNGSVLKKGTCKRLVGSGTEANRNNIYPHMASFAQPSGICFAQMLEGESKLIVADSESSAIRSINLKNWATIGVVGGARDPMDLFGFGDQDGCGMDVKLQHPLGVAFNSRKNVVYVADSYNHKIKEVQAENKLCETLHLEGEFNEPGGIGISNDMQSLYVADTNNHCIKVVDLTQNTVRPFLIHFVENDVINDGTDNLITEVLRRRPHAVFQIPMLTGTKLFLTIFGTEALKLNLEAPNSWNVFPSGGIEADRTSGTIDKLDERKRLCSLSFLTTACYAGHVEFDITLYICDTAGCCHVRTTVFQINVGATSTQLGDEHDLIHELSL